MIYYVIHGTIIRTGITCKKFVKTLSTMFCNSNVNKNFLVSRDRKIITIKSLKSKKNKLTLTLFNYLSREMWLGNL